MNYDRYAKKIFEWNTKVGWWDDPDECIYQKLQLIVTEIAEATEGERKDIMDTHLPDRKMGEVELADTLIRVLDLGGRLDLKFMPNAGTGSTWCDARCTIGKQHLGLVESVIKFARVYSANSKFDSSYKLGLSFSYSTLIKCIQRVADGLDYDLERATIDKMLFNKTRIDHTREYRGSHFDGKRF